MFIWYIGITDFLSTQHHDYRHDIVITIMNFVYIIHV